jgi:phospholipid N-methyltransferase
MRCLPRQGRISAIVSCLPLRSLPVADVEAVIAQWPRVLASDGVVVQFTYDIRKTQPVTQHLAASFATQSSHVVWANLPPARIMTSRRRK